MILTIFDYQIITMKLEDILKKELESIDHDHLSSSSENPIREDAFDISEEEKIVPKDREST